MTVNKVTATYNNNPNRLPEGSERVKKFNQDQNE